MNKEQIMFELNNLMHLLTEEKHYGSESDGRIMQNLRLRFLRTIDDSLKQIKDEITDALQIVSILPTIDKMRQIANDEMTKITGGFIPQDWDEM